MSPCFIGNLYRTQMRTNLKKMFPFCIITIVLSYMETGLNGQCIEDVERTRQKIPAYEYDGYFFPEKYEEVIVSMNITCHDIELPMEFRSYDRNEKSTIALIITSLKSTVLPPLAFEKVTRFDVLILDNLGIKKIMPSAFNSNFLKKIYLSNNNLIDIGLGIFNHLLELEFLDLSNNNITTIHEHSFLGVTRLTSLILYNNKLTEFSYNVLDPSIENMELLDLSNNNIQNIFFGNITNINELIIKNNKLKIIDICPIIHTKLYVNNNSIDKLLFDKCINQTDRLEVLDVSLNKISKLNVLTFGGSHIIQLTLSNNNITSIPTDYFYNMIFLEQLNLSHNCIEYFQHGLFDHIINLKSLDVSYNILKTVSCFYSLSSLTDLYINNNNINYINPQGLFGDLPKLEFISVDGNKFSCNNLIEIIRYIKKIEIKLDYGSTRRLSNIHGIACEESVFNNKPNFEQFLSTMLEDMKFQTRNNVDVLKNYFETDFKNSSFFKFMQKFQNSDPIQLKNTQLYEYFNTNFNQSKFYNYLESLKDSEYATDFARNVSEFINAIKNNKFDDYYRNKSRGGILDRQMYNYFNEDFEKSKFFKYLENLSNVDNGDIPKFEQLNIGYNGLLVSNILTLFFMILICSFLGILVYRFVFPEKFRKPETVELVDDRI